MSDATPPNVLFLFPDQWRWDWLGCHDGGGTPYGEIPVRTPNLDALADRGVRFTQCRTNAPLCAPARACLAQGVRYERCGVPSNGVDTPTDRDTVFRRLRDAGYRVACTGKTDLQKHGLYKGLDGWTPAMGRLGFTESANQCGKWDAVQSGSTTPADPYMAHLHAAGLAATHVADYNRRREDRKQQVISTFPTPLPRAACTDDFCGRQALDMLQRWPIDPTGKHPAPWMLWVNFPGPHEPFDPPACLRARYDVVDFPPPVHQPDDATPQNHVQLRRNYAAMCEGIDEWVGRLIDAVEARGELENTLIVFASDHGEMLGDHGRWSKAVPHEGAIHVPLIVAGPGVQEPRRGTLCHEPIELIDISATLLAAAGLGVPNDWDARPLSLWGGEPRGVQHAALHEWRMVCDGRYKLVTREGDGEDELFDLEADPAETNNLIHKQPGVTDRLRDELAALQQATP